MEDPEQLVLNMVEDVITAKEEANPPAAVASEPQEAEKTEKKNNRIQHYGPRSLGNWKSPRVEKHLGIYRTRQPKRFAHFCSCLQYQLKGRAYVPSKGNGSEIPGSDES